ncbi:MAG: MAPEG family protein [Oceanicaulis sp.]|uniref:MAPEG family protein n=1 Tax=Glycocaulis sp. TaxID=1969725 RepID=UPI0025C67431|nr:MAPEG family protein [Glycocaulis sp.]MCC5981340.1 MAPEG family protein [Oceanicaulis sp.]MCH8521402.1 MAPEG family protein [Glycocaulis sp.]
MSIELSWLSAAAALFFIQIVVEAIIDNRQYTNRELMGPRDNLAPPVAIVGRAKRATANMIEAMCMFVPLVLIVELSGRANEWTALGCAIFVLARLAFAPLYWFGVPVLRSVAFFVGIIGLIMIFLQVLPFSGA